MTEAALSFSDIKQGSRLPALTHGPITRGTLALFAGASNDHVLLHIDSDFAKSAGMPDVFAHGMLSMAYLAQLITHWVPQERLRRWHVRFTAITPLHAVVISEGEVVDVFEEDGERRARLHVQCVTGDGQKTLDGEAIMGKLDGKVAIISGSGRGIGRALAIKLASDGAKVVVNDLDEVPANEVVGAIRAAGGEAFACVGNITAPDFGERFIQSALSEFGGLDIIVNNAGYTLDGVIHKQSDDQFQAMLDVHVTAPFRILRAASEPIRVFSKKEAAEGREVIRKVVNISSMAGTHGNAGQINYSSAKAALVGMTKTMSKEWGRYKVCVNCVAFGLIETRLTKVTTDPDTKFVVEGKQIQAGIPETALGGMKSMIPLGRPGTPEEAAGGVYLLCIPESDYVSGQVLIVGGGISL